MTDWTSFFEGILTEKEFRVNEPMSRHTTYGIGGLADVFVTPTNEETLKMLLRRAADGGVPVTVIGGGSNCLVSDKGIRGITVCMQRMKPELVCEGDWITATGGVATSAVSRLAWQNQLKGMEWAVGLPGTICGAAFMNANGYGSQMKRVVESVRVVTRDGKREKTY